MNNPIHLLVRRFAATPLAERLLSPVLPRLDRWVLGWSRGRTTLSSLMTGTPIVLLHCTGAKSGQPRQVPLLGVPDGEGWILVASNWGKENHPAWYHNVKAYPEVSLTYRGETRPFVAVETTKNDRERAWRKATALYPGYSNYRQRAQDRTIPVIRLRPPRSEQG